MRSLLAGCLAAGTLTVAPLAAVGATEALPVLYHDFLGQDSSPTMGRLPHPDFRLIPLPDVTPGLVQQTVGATGPALLSVGPAATPQLTFSANFDMWFQSVPAYNLQIPDTLEANILPSGQREFDYPQGFFPLDGRGLGDYGSHNFHFTLKYEQQFVYDASAPNLFRYASDDDLWVFVNGILFADLGGMHPAGLVPLVLDLNVEASRLGLVDGGVYSYQLFFAERHTDESALVATLPGPVTPVPEASSLVGIVALASMAGVATLRRRTRSGVPG